MEEEVSGCWRRVEEVVVEGRCGVQVVGVADRWGILERASGVASLPEPRAAKDRRVEVLEAEEIPGLRCSWRCVLSSGPS